MRKKIIIGSLSILFLGTIITYFSLTKLTKNKIKHVVLHNIGVLDSDWKINTKVNDENYTTSLKSPSLLIDDIYISMEGPVIYKRFMLNEHEDQLYWIQSFDAKANSNLASANSSNDFICHVNLYHSSTEHFSRMGFNDRIGKQSQSQLITLTTGSLNVEFPEGFAYPIFSNEKILIGSQALNLNEEHKWFNLNYDFNIHYSKNKNIDFKPLYMRYLVMALPYESDTPEQKNLLEYQIPSFVQCAGPSSKNMYKSSDKYGQTTTAFWKVPKGQHTYANDITYILDLKKPKTIHYINAHAHPFAKSLELIDVTANTSIFKSIITNSKDKKAITNITSYSSVEGVTLLPDHQYKIILDVNNSSNKEIDMMASFFVYFYDQELNEKLKNNSLSFNN